MLLCALAIGPGNDSPGDGESTPDNIVIAGIQKSSRERPGSIWNSLDQGVAIQNNGSMIPPPPSETPGVAGSQSQTKLLPLYVKFNPHPIGEQSSLKTSDSTPTITVQFSPNNGKPLYIIYSTTDRHRVPGAEHSMVSGHNESSDCTLFHTTFPSDAILEVKEDRNEVTIVVKTKDKHYKWRSDSKPYPGADPDDSDVRWSEEYS
jgi:hypothetical protein